MSLPPPRTLLARALLLVPIGYGAYRFGKSVVVPGEIAEHWLPALVGAFVFFSLAMQFVVFRAVGRAAAAEPIPEVRAAAIGALRRAGVLVGITVAVVFASWIPLLGAAGAWRVLLALELVAVFLLLAAGMTMVVLRLVLDLAGRLGEEAFSTARLAVRLGGLLAAGAYAWAFWTYARRDEREVLASSLVLGVALIALGLNRLGAMDRERLLRFRSKPR